MCPNDLAFSVTALAAAIAEGKSAEELALLASILTQLGDTLTTLSLQSEICKQNKYAASHILQKAEVRNGVFVFMRLQNYPFASSDTRGTPSSALVGFSVNSDSPCAMVGNGFFVSLVG